MGGTVMVDIDSMYEQWKIDNEYIIFGDIHLIPYHERIKIKCIINNNPSKVVHSVGDIAVYYPDEVDYREGKVIIANKWSRSINDMSLQLEEMGLKRDIDYISYKAIMLIWSWKIEKKISIPYIEYMITTRCTLSCKNCSLYVPYLKKEDIPLEKFKEELAFFFRYIDYVEEFRVLGGEPLLHSQLYQVLFSLLSNYSERIGKVEIVTNGNVKTIDADVLDLCSQYGVRFHISNYTGAIDYRDNINRLIDRLQDFGIEYENALPNRWEWKAVNPPYALCSLDGYKLTDRFLDCSTHCRGLKERKIFYCNAHCAAWMGGFVEADDDDYVKVEDPHLLESLILFELGRLSKGYVSFCKNCYGMGRLNKMIVAPGEQMTNKEVKGID